MTQQNERLYCRMELRLLQRDTLKTLKQVLVPGWEHAQTSQHQRIPVGFMDCQRVESSTRHLQEPMHGGQEEIPIPLLIRVLTSRMKNLRSSARVSICPI